MTGEASEHFLRRLLGGDFLLWSPNIQAEGFLNWDKIWATRQGRWISFSTVMARCGQSTISCVGNS